MPRDLGFHIRKAIADDSFNAIPKVALGAKGRVYLVDPRDKLFKMIDRNEGHKFRRDQTLKYDVYDFMEYVSLGKLGEFKGPVSFISDVELDMETIKSLDSEIKYMGVENFRGKNLHVYHRRAHFESTKRAPEEVDTIVGSRQHLCERVYEIRQSNN